MVLEMANGLLNTQLSSDEIQRSHRVGPVKKNSLPRPVIVKFLSYKSKEKIQHAAKSLPLAGEITDKWSKEWGGPAFYSHGPK